MSWQSLVSGYLLWPGLVLFALLLVPIPFIRNSAARVVRLLGTPVTYYNLNLVLLIAVCATVGFLVDLRAHYEKYVSADRVPMTFNSHASEVEYKAKKWRLERDLYMMALTCVLYFSLNTIAAFNRQVRALQQNHAKKQA
eukprot:PhM_4_TR607/c0_g1_i1/m.26124